MVDDDYLKEEGLVKLLLGGVVGRCENLLFSSGECSCFPLEVALVSCWRWYPCNLGNLPEGGASWGLVKSFLYWEWPFVTFVYCSQEWL